MEQLLEEIKGLTKNRSTNVNGGTYNAIWDKRNRIFASEAKAQKSEDTCAGGNFYAELKKGTGKDKVIELLEKHQKRAGKEWSFIGGIHEGFLLLRVIGQPNTAHEMRIKTSLNAWASKMKQTSK